MLRLLIFLLPPLMAGAGELKKKDYGNQQTGQSLNSMQQMSPDELQKMLNSASSGQGQEGVPSGDPEELRQLLKQVQQMNGAVDERNKQLEKMLKED